MENLIRKSKGKKPTTPEDAKNMIRELYDVLLNTTNPVDIPSLFSRSYSLGFKDLQALMSLPHSPTDILKIRIYPALRDYEGKDILSFILMVEKNGKMVWDSSKPDTPQLEIQDYWTPCPNECPGGGGGLNEGNELLKEEEWERVMGRLYVKP